MRRLLRLLTPRGQAFFAGGVVLFLGGIALGQHDLSRVGVLLCGLVLLSSGLVGRHTLRLSVDRVATPSRVAVDEPATVTVTLANTGRVATPVLLAEEHLDYGLGDRPRFVLPRLAPGDVRETHYTIRSAQRGVHDLGPLGVRVRDPFGLALRAAPVSGVGRVIVLPRIHPLRSTTAVGGGLAVDGVIPHSVALHGEDDQSIRVYRDGDDLRRIHWPATARTGDLMVRQEDRPSLHRAAVLLDSRASAHHGTGRSSSLEWAVSAAASVVAHLTGRAYAVHLYTADPNISGGAREDEDLHTALDALARVRSGPPEDWPHVVQRARESTQGGLVVLCCAALDEDTARSVATLRRPGAAGVALVVGPSSPSDDGPAITAAILKASGWSVSVSTPATSIPAAWDEATSREEMRV